MICYEHPPARRYADPGIVWPSSAGYVADVVGDPFGERTFAAHTSGIDFHRGYDTLDNQDGPGQPADSGGMPVYAPRNGCIIRRYYGHFSWFDANNMSQCTELDPSSKATFSASGGVLTITGKNNGTVTFANLAKLYKTQTFQNATADNDWLIMFQLTSTVSLTGELVLGIGSLSTAQYALLYYNGSKFTVKGVDADGTMAADGTNTSPSATRWGRVRWSVADAKLYWDYSTDGTTWTNIASEGSINWGTTVDFVSFIGWNPAASGSDDTVGVSYSGGGDSSSINRFGNWLELSGDDAKWVMMHFRDFLVNVGDVVRAGQQIGITGRTGFDIKSGTIIQNHLHTEYIPNNGHSYSNDDPLNPLGATILPRASTTPSVSVVRDTAFDPYTGLVDCHRITVTVTRGTDNNFQINEFRIVGNTTSRTLNWNTRSGLDPADQDANNYLGRYFEPLAFDEGSSTYVFKYYASKAVVGSTWVSGYVKDTDGNTVWSG